MAYVAVVVLGDVENLMAGGARNMKFPTTITFTHAVNERHAGWGTVRRHKTERNLRVAVPEDASVVATETNAAWPSSRIETLKMIERQKADAHYRLGALLRCSRMSLGTNQIAMSGPYVFHHPSKGLYVLYIDLPLPSLCVDYYPPTVVGIVPRFD